MSLKKITKSYLFRKVLGWLSYLYIVFCYKTSKWQVINHNEQVVDIPAIYAFWHGRLAMVPYLSPKDRKMNVLISSHSDGEIIKNAMSHFKFNVISGSTKKRPVAALRQIIKTLRIDQNVAITPDGSRGPIYQINSNIIEIAKIAKVPIIPIVFSISYRIILNSWDKFVIPLPFSRAVLIYGRSIIVPEDALDDEIEQLKKELASRLNNITNQADMLASNQIIE